MAHSASVIFSFVNTPLPRRREQEMRRRFQRGLWKRRGGAKRRRGKWPGKDRGRLYLRSAGKRRRRRACEARPHREAANAKNAPPASRTPGLASGRREGESQAGARPRRARTPRHRSLRRKPLARGCPGRRYPYPGGSPKRLESHAPGACRRLYRAPTCQRNPHSLFR